MINLSRTNSRCLKAPWESSSFRCTKTPSLTKQVGANQRSKYRKDQETSCQYIIAISRVSYCLWFCSSVAVGRASTRFNRCWSNDETRFCRGIDLEKTQCLHGFIVWSKSNTKQGMCVFPCEFIGYLKKTWMKIIENPYMVTIGLKIHGWILMSKPWPRVSRLARSISRWCGRWLGKKHDRQGQSIPKRRFMPLVN